MFEKTVNPRADFIIIIIIIISSSSSSSINLLIWEFFTSALADGFIQETERQQVSASILDSYEYSDRSQQCYSLDDIHFSSSLQILLLYSRDTFTTIHIYMWKHNQQ